MSLKKELQDNLRSALKDKKEIETTTLRMLNAAILNKEKEKRAKLAKEGTDEKELVEKSQLADEEIVEVISSEVKKRKEAASEFDKGDRKNLADKEREEMEILKRYLPEQLSEEEVKELAKKVIEKVEAEEMRDIGRVMAELMPQLKGKADGSLVSRIVKELLTPAE